MSEKVESNREMTVDPHDYGFDADELSCGTVVFDEAGRVLLVRAAGGTGRWGVPKGHMKPGETLEECAVRETLEETGVRVEVASPYRNIVRYRVGLQRTKDVCLFLAVPVGGAPTDACGETTQVGFVPMGDALRRVSKDLAGILSSTHRDWRNLSRDEG